ILKSLMNEPTFSRTVMDENSTDGPAMQALVSHWVDLGHTQPQSRLQIAERFQLDAGVSAAKEIITNRNATVPSQASLERAIRFLSDHGGMGAIEDLESLLDDRTWSPAAIRERAGDRQMNRGQARTLSINLQASDLALLGLLKLTEQNPRDYGFANLR